MTLSIFSFFSGSGFLDLGFERADFNICYINELHVPFLEAYKYSRERMNMPSPKYGYFSGGIDACLSGSEGERLSQALDSEHEGGRLVGFIGGPPCPDFSVGGKNKGHKGDHGRLSQSYVDLICKKKPDFFVFENVKGLLRTKKHKVFYEELKAQLKLNGFVLSERLINSIEYAVPQDRARVILLGINKDTGLFKGVTESLFESCCRWIDMTTYPEKSAFAYDWPTPENNSSQDFPEELTVAYWFSRNDVQNHANSGHHFQPRAGLVKFQTVLEGDCSKKSYKRLHRFRYSPTAAYGNNEVHIHPTEARRISAAEALAIQSLPKDFELPPTMTLTNMFKTIGNGVPYLAAKGIAITLQDCIARLNYELNCK